MTTTGHNRKKVGMVDVASKLTYGPASGTVRDTEPRALRPCGCLPRWYVVAASPGHDAAAEFALSAGGWRVYRPLCCTRSAGHPPRITSLFPGYLFVFIDTSQGFHGRICRTQFVRTLLGTRERPSPVPAGVIEHLQARTSDRRVVDDPLCPGVWQNIPPGAAVEVVDGPLASLRGIVALSGKGRCRVLLSLLGRECVMEIPTQALQVA